MSQENVELVRRAFEAYSRGDIDGAVSDFAPDCRYTAAGLIPDRIGVFRGPEEYKGFIGWVTGEFDGVQSEVDELIDAGDQVVVGSTLRGRGKQSGAQAKFTFWQVWTVQTASSFAVRALPAGMKPSKPPGCASRALIACPHPAPHSPC